MRVVASLERSDATSWNTLELREAERDVCLRAVFWSAEPLELAFVDATKLPRGDATHGAAGAVGLVPPRGPACMRKGETLRLVPPRGVPDGPARVVLLRAP